MPRFAAAPWKRWKNIGKCMSELAAHIERYIDSLKREGASAHTVIAYECDLAQFLHYLSPPEMTPPEVRAIDLLLLREWLASLYNQDLGVLSIRRKLAAVRGLFRFLQREGILEVNVAKLVRTPKAPIRLPEVMTAEQANNLINGVAVNELHRPHPARDRAIFELLYG